jgi:hypothetical protein
MSTIINITNENNQYKVCKWFQNYIPQIANYLMKTLGVDHKEKKDPMHKKIKEGNKPARTMKESVYNHLLRKTKSNLIIKKYQYESR